MNKMKKSIIQILIIAMFFCIIPKTEYATETYKVGDINGDRVIDSRDTLRILHHIAASTISKIGQEHPDWILKDEKLKAGDINGDGVIDSRDTLRELEYIAAVTVPKIANNHPEWKKYIENKWTVEPTAIKLDKTNITIYKGKIEKITSTITPTNTTNKIVKWSSSNTNVATVDGLGNVTGKSDGIAIITATLSNSIKATCTVTVNSTSVNQTQAKSISVNPIIVNSIKLKQIDSTVPVGTTLQLNAIITPLNASNKTIIWSSSNNQIAKVSASGLVYGLKPGMVTITATTSNGKKATCIIRVNIPPKSISLNKTATTMSKGDTLKLNVNFNPINTTSKEVNWKSSNPKVVSVNSLKTINGFVTIKAESVGTATITATHKYGQIAVCKVTVDNKKLSTTNKSNKSSTTNTSNSGNNSNSSNNKNENSSAGKTYNKEFVYDKFRPINEVIKLTEGDQLKVTRIKNFEYDKKRFEIRWKSSDSKIATVNNGLIVAKKQGKAYIQADLYNKDNIYNGQVLVINLTIEPKNKIAVKKISINHKEVSIKKGDTKQLKVTIEPNNATDKTIKWETSNSNTVSVSRNGLISGDNEGTATITAKTINGKTATCKVKVTKKENKTKTKTKTKTSSSFKVTISKSVIYLRKGQRTRINYKYTPTNINIKKKVFVTYNKNMVKVDKYGYVTGVSRGKTTVVVKITSKDGITKQAKCTVIVI